MPLAKALKEWETRSGKVAAEEKEIKLYGGLVFDAKRVFINKLDNSAATLRACERLALSTNQIDRMASLAGMENLKILSLSRNMLKKIERLEDVGATLEELWLSYNQISSLDGLASLSALQVLYLSNNRVADWSELDKLASLPMLRELLLLGNPIQDTQPDRALYRAHVIKRVPQIQKLDNEMIAPSERDAAAKL